MPPVLKQKIASSLALRRAAEQGQTVEERLEVVRQLRPELCTCNLGTMNYGGFPMIPKYHGQWKFDWEEPYLDSTRTEPFVKQLCRHRVYAQVFE